MQINDERLVSLLKDKDRIVKQIRKDNGKIEKIQEGMNKLGLELNPIKEEIIELTQKAIDEVELGEWEYLAEVKLEKGKAMLVVKNAIEDADQIREEFLEKFKASKEIEAEDGSASSSD